MFHRAFFNSIIDKHQHDALFHMWKSASCWCLSIIELKNARWNTEIRKWPTSKTLYVKKCIVLVFINYWTKRTSIAMDVAHFLPVITVIYNSTLFLYRCISRSRYLALNITVAIWTWKEYWKIGGSIFFGSIPEFSFNTRPKPVKTLHLYSRELSTPRPTNKVIIFASGDTMLSPTPNKLVLYLWISIICYMY